ncbi:MAG: hypothetical protein MOB07_15080 [Acidobacteria bacterium]|nr:hypothetical protein [Acidobacteriota bacterium]
MAWRNSKLRGLWPLVWLAMALARPPAGLGQSPPATPAQAAKIKAAVEKIGVAGDITVESLSGERYHGAITEIEAGRFELAEVDLQQKVSLRYDEVKKVSKGYGRKKNIHGQRIPPRRSRIVAIAVLGGLFGLLLFGALGTK